MTHVINPNQLALFTEHYPKRPSIRERTLTIGDVKQEGADYERQRQHQQGNWEQQYGKAK